MERDRYKGVPLGELRIEGVIWTPDRAAHIRTRTVRYTSGETNLEPEWANEAALDPARIVAVAGEKEETSSLKVVGYIDDDTAGIAGVGSISLVDDSSTFVTGSVRFDAAGLERQLLAYVDGLDASELRFVHTVALKDLLDLIWQARPLAAPENALGDASATAAPRAWLAEAGRGESRDRHVVPHPDGGWDVRAPGARRASAHTATQDEAIRRARAIVRNAGGGEVVVHRRDGTVRSSDTVAPEDEAGLQRTRR